MGGDSIRGVSATIEVDLLFLFILCFSALWQRGHRVEVCKDLSFLFVFVF